MKYIWYSPQKSKYPLFILTNECFSSDMVATCKCSSSGEELFTRGRYKLSFCISRHIPLLLRGQDFGCDCISSCDIAYSYHSNVEKYNF